MLEIQIRDLLLCESNRERVLDPIGTKNYTLWRDAADNVLSYCCIDMSARDYSRFGLLFSRNGSWNDQQVVPYDFVLISIPCSRALFRIDNSSLSMPHNEIAANLR